MKIVKFNGSNINGQSDIEVNFHEDITFVVGINGTGKTTVLNFIVSLLMLKFDFLATQNYSLVSICIKHEGKMTTLCSQKIEDGALLFKKGNKEEVLQINAFEWNDFASFRDGKGAESSFYDEQLLQHAHHPIMSFIKQLPTPMYLGLNRRILNTGEDSVRRYGYRNLLGRPKRRNVFSIPLSQGLDDALPFASVQYRSAQRRKEELDKKFRQDLVLDLIDLTPSDFSGKLSEPNENDFEKIKKAKDNLSRLPGLLGVDAEKIRTKTEPLFKFVESIQSGLSKKHGLSTGKSPKDRNRAEVALRWEFNKNLIYKIDSISNLISKYSEDTNNIFSELQKFEKDVNYFFSDSGKEIHFNNVGDIIFKINDCEDENDIKLLSSGEIQILLIFVHFHFNKNIVESNIFIIDEPELSLHVEWQERFIDLMVEKCADNDTQFIAATHAPSIILDRTEKCVDLSPGLNK
ncbi:AAA family ATPase [Saccharibacter floricola]|nr:AAA family ATPase [Saccharibacter floricola]